ncbi:hypothetical protein B4U79_05929, partial [Dinothrombium tinctorium]
MSETTGRILKIFCHSWRTIIGFIAPLAFMPMAISEYKETKCGYVLSVMAIFWVFEPVHLAVTALMPIALLPLLGILSTEKASLPYMKSANSLFIGGMLLAIAIEHSMLHKRVALKILLIVGSSVK